ncbi:MAG: hypothetical protein M9942_07700 [Microthrixaceae bacterium]|nr:hypothetical protein [Microthrixaceae bacterium]
MAASEGQAGPADPEAKDPDAPEWTQQVTDLVTDSVDKVRSRTTGPLLGFAQGMVYAVVAAVVAVPVLVVLFIGFIRLFNWAVPGDVWIVYAILAVVLWIAGVISWSRREDAEPGT